MRRILISDTDWIQVSAAFSGGSWFTGLGLGNLVDYRPQVVAEAADATSGSTQFIVDLGVARSIGLLYFANLITTSAGTIRVRVATDAGITSLVYDSGTVSVRPQDAAGSISDAEFVALGRTRIFVPPAPVIARYIEVNVVDTGAPSPLQIGCFCACSVYEASLNFSYGWSLTPVDLSDVVPVTYGSTYFNQRGMRNRLNFGWQALPESEAFTQMMRLVRIKGKTVPLVVSLFPADLSPAIGAERASVYGTLSNDAQISNPFFTRYAATLQVDQLI